MKLLSEINCVIEEKPYPWLFRNCETELFGCALEYSGTKIFMNGPIVCKLCEGESERSLVMYCNFFHTFNFIFALPVYYLSEGFKALLESFWN